MRFDSLKEMLSGGRGRLSSKRGSMVFFMLLFSMTIIVNLATGKELSAELRTQLFEIVVILIGAVFGEPIVQRIRLRGDDNKKQDETKQ